MNAAEAQAPTRLRTGWFQSINVPMAIFVVAIALLTLGLTAVYSASSSVAGLEKRAQALRRGEPPPEARYHDAAYFRKQLVAAALGLPLMLGLSRLDYRRLKRLSFWIMAGSFLFCLMVWAPGLGLEVNGARRWVRLGPMQFQPSELARLGLIIYMAKMLDDRHRFIQSFFSGVFPAMVVAGAFGLIIVVEPDFGAAFVLGLVIYGMWICGEVRWFHLLGLGAASAPAAAMAFVLQPYRIRRFFAFFSDDPEVLRQEGYQLYQSLIAVGSGGSRGVGLGESMQKHHYLFAGHNDFIFAIVAEELGFYGATAVVLLYAALVALGWWVALNASDLFGSLLATGITLSLFLGAAINMGVALGLLPTKGLVLPLVSYGGSSLIVTMASLGILMNIAGLQFHLIRPAARPIEL